MKWTKNNSDIVGVIVVAVFVTFNTNINREHNYTFYYNIGSKPTELILKQITYTIEYTVYTDSVMWAQSVRQFNTNTNMR